MPLASSSLFHDFSPNARDWIIALISLAFYVAVAALFQPLAKLVVRKKEWKLLDELAPAISGLIYIIAVDSFLETAPLHPKIIVKLENILYVLAVVILMNVIRRATLVALEWSSMRSNQSAMLQQGFIPLLKNVITLFVLVSGAIMILKHFNYDVMTLVTALGVGSLAVGLAAKDTLSNMISGFTLIIDRNLRPGDRVNLSGSVGNVEEIGLRSTRIKIGDGNTLIVPNSEMVNTKILNMSVPSRESVCSATIRVPYSVPFARIKAACLITLEQITRVNKEAGKSVLLASISDGHQVISISFWLRDMDDAAAALSELYEKLMIWFHQENIPLLEPSPQQSAFGMKLI